ncbi:hypothetical protein B7494_g5473 [Chlorociboria aeruginascens]|nr:hypothetical protein B7494_g5473 [Chlorociboria aeruginascens]
MDGNLVTIANSALFFIFYPASETPCQTSILTLNSSSGQRHMTARNLLDIKAFEKGTADLVKIALEAKLVRGAHDMSIYPSHDAPKFMCNADFTFESAPTLIAEKLGEEERAQHLQPGSWRPLLSRCEDRPLAMCTFATIKPVDLVAVDRVYPYSTSEIYYLHHEVNQKWYWISDQTPEELIMMIILSTCLLAQSTSLRKRTTSRKYRDENYRHLKLE